MASRGGNSETGEQGVHAGDYQPPDYEVSDPESLLLGNRYNLVHVLSVEEAIPWLRQHMVIDKMDEEQILRGHDTSVARAGELIDKVIQRGSRDFNFLMQFIEYEHPEMFERMMEKTAQEPDNEVYVPSSKRSFRVSRRFREDVTKILKQMQKMAEARSQTTINNDTLQVKISEFEEELAKRDQQIEKLKKDVWILSQQNSELLHRSKDEQVENVSLLREIKKEFRSMSLSERRSKYNCGSQYLELKKISSWKKYYQTMKYQSGSPTHCQFGVDPALNSKVSLWHGDITTLEVDCVVMSSSGTLNNCYHVENTVEAAVFKATGPMLVHECRLLNSNRIGQGDAYITDGYRLPAKYVIHTFGPTGSGDNLLVRSYTSCLRVMEENNLRSIAFPCISAGNKGFPPWKAAPIALETVRKYLEAHREKVDRIVFCLYQSSDVEIYERIMPGYFPVTALTS